MRFGSIAGKAGYAARRPEITGEVIGGGYGGSHGGDMQPLCRRGRRRLARTGPPHPPAPRATGSKWKRPAHHFMHTDGEVWRGLLFAETSGYDHVIFDQKTTSIRCFLPRRRACDLCSLLRFHPTCSVVQRAGHDTLFLITNHCGLLLLGLWER